MAIASVVQVRGRYRKAGARLAISSSGVKFGTVGGAGLELGWRKFLEKPGLDSSYIRKRGGRVETFLLNKDGKEKRYPP